MVLPGALAGLTPVFLCYVLSFIYVAIYWSNLHHPLAAAKGVDGAILWANTNLLFWLSLIPFATGWMGENHFAIVPVAVYGLSLLAPALAYTLLQSTIVRANGPDHPLARALGRDLKGKISPLFCVAGSGLAFVSPWLGCAALGALALIWLVRDRRIERILVRV